MVYLLTTLLQIFHRMCQWKKIENCSIFGDDMDKSLRFTFLGHPVSFNIFYHNFYSKFYNFCFRFFSDSVTFPCTWQTVALRASLLPFIVNSWLGRWFIGLIDVMCCCCFSVAIWRCSSSTWHATRLISTGALWKNSSTRCHLTSSTRCFRSSCRRTPTVFPAPVPPAV